MRGQDAAVCAAARLARGRSLFRQEERRIDGRRAVDRLTRRLVARRCVETIDAGVVVVDRLIGTAGRIRDAVELHLREECGVLPEVIAQLSRQSAVDQFEMREAVVTGEALQPQAEETRSSR